MIVTCEACFTSFNLNDELIKPSGSKVRCSKCQKVFKAYPPILEDVTPPQPSELSDKTTDFFSPPTLSESPPLDDTGVRQMGAAPDFSFELPGLPDDFKDIDEFDFPELDKLLSEDSAVNPEVPDSSSQADQSSALFLSSSEPSEPLSYSDASDKPTGPDFSDISPDLPETKDRRDDPGSDFETPTLMESEVSDYLSDKSDEMLEQALSGISLDESFDGAEEQPEGVNLESETGNASFEPEPLDFSLDDFEKSLEMDFTDISLTAAIESESAADRKTGASETVIKPDQTPEDAALSEDAHTGFNDIEALDMKDIEGLLDKQEISSGLFNDGAESFRRIDAAAVFPPPLSPASTETDQPLEMMDDRYLNFDELQLDMDDSKSATLQEVKESFKPRVPEISAYPSGSSRTLKQFSLEAASEDKEKEVLIDAGIEEDLEDTIPAPKKGISPAILVAVILAVIAAAGYGGYMLLNSMGISIPFISRTAPSKVSDPGNLSIKSFDINSKFIDNETIGKLFVITGKVKNEYPMARGSIRISGKIYTKDKALAKAETVFCGNILSDAELSKADLTTFQQRLQNPSGDNLINQKVLSGAAIPFMIVFSNLPPNLEEFSTEVTSSTGL